MQVRVCNFRDKNFDNEFFNSLVDTGFAVVTHHGIDFGLIRESQCAWKSFFLSSDFLKSQFVNKEDGNSGYKGFKTEKAVGAKKPDLKEFFHWRPGKELPLETSDFTQVLYYQLEDVGNQLLSVIDAKMGTNYKNMCSQSDNTILRTIYYPALDFSKEPESVRAAAHEDINFITLLVAASAPGLEVMDKEGKWHVVPHEENSIVVNVGDMLQLASSGALRSTTHRVVNPDNSRNDRVSMPLFIHPFSSIMLAPGITAKQYLDQRLAEIYGKV